MSSRGNGQYGSLGNGRGIGVPYSWPLPQPVLGNVSFATVSAGSSYACALTAAGKAYCWVGASSALVHGPRTIEPARLGRCGMAVLLVWQDCLLLASSSALTQLSATWLSLVLVWVLSLSSHSGTCDADPWLSPRREPVSRESLASARSWSTKTCQSRSVLTCCGPRLSRATAPLAAWRPAASTAGWVHRTVQQWHPVHVAQPVFG